MYVRILVHFVRICSAGGWWIDFRGRAPLVDSLTDLATGFRSDDFCGCGLGCAIVVVDLNSNPMFFPLDVLMSDI